MEFTGNNGARNDVLPVGAQALVARYSFVFPRTIGDTTATQVLAAIRNLSPADARRIVRVTFLGFSMEETAAVATQSANIRALRAVASALGGGTNVPKSYADALQATGSAAVTALAATSQDGAAATPITGGSATPGALSADAYGNALGTTMHTAVGQRYNVLIPLFRVPLILRTGEAVVVQVAPPAGANPATAQYICAADVEEFLSA